jgi:hypothetical protein
VCSFLTLSLIGNAEILVCTQCWVCGVGVGGGGSRMGIAAGFIRRDQMSPIVSNTYAA